MAVTGSAHLGGVLVLVLVITFTACVVNPAGCHTHRWHSDKHVALFVFGDSLFDPGNNNYINTTPDFQANFRPYGESFFNIPTGRFSDGRLIPDFIAEFAKLPLIPAYLKPGNHEYFFGANFASGGAGVLVKTHSGLVVNLKTQLRYFKDLRNQLSKKLGNNAAKQLLSNAVYLFSCGVNDYTNATRTSDSIDRFDTREQFVEMVIGNLTEVIKDIYDMGGRKFGLVNMPPVSYLPSSREKQLHDRCMEELTALMELHNHALSRKLNKLEMQLNGFTYSKFDLYSCLLQRIESPSIYGFKDGDTACCGSGPFRGISSCGGKRKPKQYLLCENASEHVFFDSNHPGEAASQQLAELFWHGSSEVTWPYNLKSLF